MLQIFYKEIEAPRWAPKKLNKKYSFSRLDYDVFYALNISTRTFKEINSKVLVEI